MSNVRVFITGVTGYIGGDLLYLINKCEPEWKVACLVRDKTKASDLVSKYPSVRVVHGSLDSVDLIEEEAANSNIIYHCADCDHRKSALAISKGISRSSTTPVYWIHTSGAGILTFQNFAQNNFESASGDEKIFNDWDNVNELTSLPDKAIHRHVDKIVLDASSGHTDRIKTAIVAPPAIYGLGRGPGNVESKQVNIAVQVALRNSQGLQMGDGNNIWHGVHVRDLSRLYLMLGEAAVSGNEKATWNDTGYYLVENGPFRWGDIMQRIAEEGWKQGYLQTNKVQSVDFAQSQKHHKLFPYLCGTTSRGVGKRARILLGWKPEEISLRDDLPRIIEHEAKDLKIPNLSKSNTSSSTKDTA